mmetsp:Transcript_10190/g.10072  ORF Transcript_10190/g.10072 Transcript_10190/m.10072 type:complete len:178 (-) Transcript_10190:308-841(-)
MCNVNQYCMNKVCVPAKKEGQICRGRYECEFGLQCYAKGPLFSKFKCYPPHKLGDDYEFDTSMMTNGYDNFLGYDSVCESHYSVINEDYPTRRICRKGDRSEEQDTNKLRQREGIGGFCNYYTYNDPSAPGSPVKVKDYSKCGFNRDSSAWCSLRRGDNSFTKVLEEIKKIDWNDIN